MAKTGISIKDWLSLVAIILSLLPICIILIRKTYWHAVPRLLIAICLLYFISSLLLATSPLAAANATSINAIFALLRLIVFFLLFRLAIQHPPLREILNILLTAFLSASITVYALKGIDKSASAISMAESALMMIATLLVFIQLLSSRDMFLFDSPLFWITGGTFCYFSMSLLTEIVLRSFNEPLTAGTLKEKEILLSVVGWIRYIFYIIAASLQPAYKEPADHL